jgi:hypothetical protein
LDAHWLEIFTPVDAIGLDGISHQRRAGPARPTSGSSHPG